MKKETFIAIFLGVLAGLGVAMVLLEKARERQMTSTQSINTSIQLTPSVLNKNSQIQTIEITQPEDGSISSSKTVDIKGKASAGALLVVQSPIKNIILKLEKDDFSIAAFPLALGENIIRVSIYPKDSQSPSQERELKIYYLDEQ